MAIAVKICGLTSDEAVDAAVRCGAAMAGFVFFPASPRSLAPERAAALAGRVPEGIFRVGVVVDPEDDLLGRILEVVPLDMVQLHGRETPARVAEVRERTGCMVMKAIRVAGAADLAALEDHAAVADYLLFDAKPPAGALVPGGHGRPFDWRILSGVAPGRPWLLAGGIDRDNVDEAVRLSGARAVDVSSGVERRPGRKDVRQIEAFLKHVSVLEPGRPTPHVEVQA